MSVHNLDSSQRLTDYSFSFRKKGLHNILSDADPDDHSSAEMDVGSTPQTFISISSMSVRENYKE
jgi:hypothetical protein